MSSLTSKLAATDAAPFVPAEDDEFFQLNVFAHKGCERLQKLLRTLVDVFPDNVKLSLWLRVFDTTILGTPEREKWLMDRWHREMTTFPDGRPRVPDLYQSTKERRIEVVLDAGVWVFEEIGARELFFDSDLNEEEQEEICKHFDGINVCTEWMATMPEDMMEQIMLAVRGLDPTQEVSAATLFPLLQRSLGLVPSEDGSSTDAVGRVVGWTTKMLKLMGNGGLQALLGLAGEAAAEAGTGMPDFASVVAAVNKEMLDCGSLAHAAEHHDMDEEQLDNLQKVLSSVSSVGGGSGGGRF